MSDLLLRKTWDQREDESTDEFRERTKEQRRNFFLLKQQKGPCFMVKYGEGDVRPMFASDISIKALRNELRTPAGTPWDCPLCQPYDAWNGMGQMDYNRRALCKIVAPKYRDGCADEQGTFAKCPCQLDIRKRTMLKFKEV